MSKHKTRLAIITMLVALIISACGSSGAVEVSSDMLEQLKASYASEVLDVDYDSAESFESALNNGEDVSLKTVTFIPYRIEPDSGVGFNMISGEHLNFASDGSVDVAEKDTVTVIVKEVKTMLGSWVIKYELIGIDKTSEQALEETAGIDIVETDVSETVSKAIDNSDTDNVVEDEPQSSTEEAIDSDTMIDNNSTQAEQTVPTNETTDAISTEKEETTPQPESASETENTNVSSVETAPPVVEEPKVEEPAPVSVKVAGQDRNVSLAPGTMVWKSATGSKFHTHNDCGSMNPDKAQQITIEQAIQLGLEACDKCY